MKPLKALLTAICSVLLCIGAFAQNTPPYLAIDTIHMVNSIGGTTIYTSSHIVDDQSNPISIGDIVTPPANGTIIQLTPAQIVYQANNHFYGIDYFSFVACDTVYNTQTSLCNTLTIYIVVDSPYLQVDTSMVRDTICVGSQYTYQLPVVTGGASHGVTYTSTDLTDILWPSANNDSVTIVKTQAVNSTIFVTIVNYETDDTIGPFPYLQFHVADTLTGSFIVDNTYQNEISFNPDAIPLEFIYNLEWVNSDSTFGANYLGYNTAEIHDSVFIPFYWVFFVPETPGFVTLTITDSIMGCVSIFSTPYNGINHGLNYELPVLSTSTNAVTPLYIHEQGGNIYDIDWDPFTYIDTLTSPHLGTVTWDSYGMKYTPRLDTCGIDSFYVLTRDQSNFEPHNLIDTVLVVINISCNKVASISSTTPVLCAGDSTAVLSVTTNVTGILTYNWSNGATTPTLTSVAAGQYRVTVTNLANQSATAFINVTAPQPLNLVSNVQHVSCYGANNGRIFNSSTGGTYPHQYSLNGGPLVSGNFTQLVEGYYYVMVVDNNGCTDTATYYIDEPDSLSVSVATTPTCGTSCSGVGTINVMGGTPPYTYTWSDGQQQASVNTLCAGNNYTVTVRDSKQCTINKPVSVTQGPNPLTLSITKQNIDCNHLTGSLTALPANGTAPYTYTWSNFTNAQTASNLTVGNYFVVAHDATGCEIQGSDSILNISGITGSLLSNTGPLCSTSQNGGARVSVTGGIMPYTYVWQGNPSITDTASNLGVGPHTVTINDAGGCSSNFIFTLTPQSAITLNDSVVHKHCIDYQKGEIIARAENGIPPYSYHWSGSSSTGSYLSNLNAGVYSYTVTDAYGCTASNTISVWMYSFFISANATTENCGFDNASIQLKGYNGTPPYTYLWNTNPPFIGDSIGGLSAGSYPFVVTDSLGCRRSGTKNILNSCYSTIIGNVFYDTNGNCIRDTGELPFNNQLVARATNGFDFYYSNVDGYGTYNIRIPQVGNYQVSLVHKDCYILCGGSLTNIPVTVMDTIYQGPDIGVRIDPNSFDLAVSASGSTPNPGFNMDYYIYPTRLVNNGPTSGTVTFQYDDDLTFVNVNPIGVVNTSNHTITWNINNIPLAPSTGQLHAVFYVSTSALPGTSYSSVATITPMANDCNPQNNVSHIVWQVAAAYDPNMKVAQPANEILETDSVINYTIHFQNTGTDTTHFVILKDTLSNLVDPGSIEFLGSSHQPCRYELSENGILTFTFDPIYLPDSATNEEASKGFVSYSIKKKASTDIGAVIKNTAHIYFDFNPAIVTNTTENEVTTLVSIRDIKASDNLSAKVYPNPFAEAATIETSEALQDAKLVISNISGQIVQQYQGDGSNKWHINKQHMAQGMYTFAIYSDGIVKIRGKLIAE